MSNSLKKVAAISLSLATAVSLAGGVMIASAQTMSIADLMAQITALQAQLMAMQGSTVATTSTTFTKDLTLGSRGTEVSALQQMLISKGLLTAVSAPTGYFGNATKAAVAAWQSASGISPAAGYFGAKSRAYVNSLAVGTTTTTTTTTTGGTVVVAPSTGLKVTLASDNPIAGSLVSGASRVDTLKVNLTAGTSGAATITGIKFTKTGVVSDSAISNAYLVESGKVVAQYSSISGGVITFSGLNLNVNAGQTRGLSLGIDTTSASVGNTIAFKLNAASDVTAVDYNNAAITAAGTFPVNGNTLTITTVENPSIATLTIASSTVGTSVNAGTSGVLVSQWTLTANNSSVKLSSIKFNVIGSADKNNIQNIKLMVNGTQVGSTLSSVGSDGTAYFDLSSSPAIINTGSSNMQIYADIMGSPSFNFDFGILNTYDVYGIDSTYNTGVSVTVNGGSTGSTSGHQITINTGSITVGLATDTPTGNIALGGSGTTLAKYTIYAAGEAIKVKFLDFKLTFTGTTGTISTSVKNISLVDNAGGQVGSTISTPPSANTCAQGTAGYISSSVYGDCFGTAASPINYIVPANTTRTLTLKGDIQTGAAFTTVTAALSGNSSNLQGVTSSQSANSGSVSGSALTLSTTPLSASLDNAFGTQTYAKGASAVKIGSFVLSASSAEGVNVSNLTITMSSSSTNFQNLKATVDGVQFGLVQNTLGASQVTTFSGTAISVPKGGTKTVSVYADVLSSATAATYTGLTTLTSCTGTGATTNTSVSCAPTSIAGQSVTLSSGATMTVTMDSDNSVVAPSKQVVVGTTGISVAKFRFRETSNLEPIEVSSLIIRQNVSATTTKSGFSNLTLWDGTTSVGTAALVDGGSTANTYKATFSTPFIVPQNGGISLELKGNVADINSITDNSTSTFSITASSTDVTALGQSSKTAAVVTLSSTTGNTMTALRSKLSLSATTLGSTSSRGKSTADNLASLVFTANAGGDVLINTVSIKLAGSAVSNGTSIAATLVPYSGSCGSTAITGTTQQTVTAGAGNSNTVNFAFSTPLRITAGKPYTACVQVDSTPFHTSESTITSFGLIASINAAGDVNWGEDTTTTGLSLDNSSTAIPFTVSNVTYGQQ